MHDYIIAIDQGTTSTKTALYSLDGRLEAISNNPIRQIYPEDGWVEHDPHDILDSIKKGIAGVVAEAGINDGCRIVSVGIDNQGETIIPFDRITGEPLYNAIVWQDRRTTAYCETLRKSVEESVITEKTGLFLDPYFSAPKMNWLVRNSGNVRNAVKNGTAVVATSDVWLLYMLTGGKALKTDVTTASRTLLYNINTLEWDHELLELFEIPAHALPEVAPSSYFFGYTDPAICSGITAPVNASVVDQQASLFGHTCFSRGDAKITYGTGGFLLLNTGNDRVKLADRISTTIAAQYDRNVSYAIDGGVYCVASCINWLIKETGIVSKPEEISLYNFDVNENCSTFFVPSMAGISAPWWKSGINGAFLGLSLATRGGDMVRAVLEGLAFRFLDIVEIIRKNGFNDISSISVDGGVSRNDFLMQYQADLLGTVIRRPAVHETTSLGCFYLAGLESGVWKNADELKKFETGGRVFTPEKDNSAKIKKHRIWQGAVKSVIQWHESFCDN